MLRYAFAVLTVEWMIFSGIATYNTYLEVLGKSGRLSQAEDTFRDMQKQGILPAVNTFTIMINIYGKVSHLLVEVKPPLSASQRGFMIENFVLVRLLQVGNFHLLDVVLVGIQP